MSELDKWIYAKGLKKTGFVSFLTQCVLTMVFFVMALTFTGDWLLIFVHVLKYLGIIEPRIHVDRSTLQTVFDYLCLKDYPRFWISTMCSGYGVYFTMGFLFHWHYYVRQKDNPDVWKCQPKRWISRDLELDEIKEGSVSLFVTNTWTSLIACYIYNGGYSTVYYNWDDYGVLWWFLQFPIIFIYLDYSSYWIHRIFHMPYLYTRFHKTHHKYQQPTAFSVTALHPVEISLMQFILVAPLFTIPTHWVAYHTIAMYIYYHGIVTHSGINFKAKWWQPWQPNAVFHDNHHQYYHVNFGFNCELWDKLHNTYRKPDRIYNEKIFFGKGKSISKLSERELQKEIMERKTESRTAYKNNYNPYIIESANDVVGRNNSDE